MNIHSMLYLLGASLIWAFSFGLIKGNLTGVDPSFVSFVRMGISFLLFAPFIRTKGVGPRLIGLLLVVGSVQFGLMYLFYIRSFQLLQAYQVALFTVLTPIYVALIGDAFENKITPIALVSAGLAVIGAAIISYREVYLPSIAEGFLLVQASNVCFAFGQIYYKKILRTEKIAEHGLAGIVYLGSVVTTGIAAKVFCDLETIHITMKQALTLLYLGAIASGLSFFWWNIGARRTDSGTLAVFNNVKIPLAVCISLIIFGEHSDMLRLALGGGTIAVALFFNHKNKKRVRSN